METEDGVKMDNFLQKWILHTLSSHLNLNQWQIKLEFQLELKRLSTKLITKVHVHMLRFPTVH